MIWVLFVRRQISFGNNEYRSSILDAIIEGRRASSKKLIIGSWIVDERQVFSVNGKTSGIQLAVRRSWVPFFSQTSRDLELVRFHQQTVMSFISTGKREWRPSAEWITETRIKFPSYFHQFNLTDLSEKNAKAKKQRFFFFSFFSADKLESSSSSS